MNVKKIKKFCDEGSLIFKLNQRPYNKEAKRYICQSVHAQSILQVKVLSHYQSIIESYFYACKGWT